MISLQTQMNLCASSFLANLLFRNKHVNIMNQILSSRSKYLQKALFATNKEEFKKKQEAVMAKGLPKRKPIDGVKKIILVSSGKGGVGKSTTAVNLAVALKTVEPNKCIGLLDADVFGPSVPLMMNLHDTPLLDEKNLMLPLSNYGIKCMSMGFLIAEGAPVIWRGLMVMQALDKLLRQVSWGNIDCLVIDTPPGTGDTHLSLIQNLPIAGALLVTTPQSASIQVTKRGAVMFQKLSIPIIGIVENMSSIECPSCNNSISLFGDETSKLTNEISTNILQKVPLRNQISKGTDEGVPIVIAESNGSESTIYKNLAQQVWNFLEKPN